MCTQAELTLQPIIKQYLNSLCSLSMSQNCTFDGLARLSQLGYEVGWLWYDILALVLYSILFLVIAYIVLLLIKKEK